MTNATLPGRSRSTFQCAGYEVVCAYDGVEALEIVERERPDMIVCDTVMPRKDGFELLADLQANPQTKDIPVIAMVGTAGLSEMEMAARTPKVWGSGFSSSVEKPLNLRKLLTFVGRTFESLGKNEAKRAATDAADEV